MGREGQRSDKKPQRRDTWSEKRTVRERQRTDKKPQRRDTFSKQRTGRERQGTEEGFRRIPC